MVKQLRATKAAVLAQRKGWVMGKLLSPQKKVRESFDPEKLKEFYGISDAEWKELKQYLIDEGLVEEV